MALLSGEVETSYLRLGLTRQSAFRMALLSGEVETRNLVSSPLLNVAFRMALLSGEVETWPGVCRWCRAHSSGWLCYPGKLKQQLLRDLIAGLDAVPDGFAIRGS